MSTAFSSFLNNTYTTRATHASSTPTRCAPATRTDLNSCSPQLEAFFRHAAGPKAGLLTAAMSSLPAKEATAAAARGVGAAKA